MEPVSLFDLVSDAVADLHPVAASRSITLKESRTGNLTLFGDARELSRVIGNLLMNAIEHSPANSEILISARETENEHVALSVVDAGGGIPEEDLGKIFDAGWRGTPSRTPSPAVDVSAGAGLGLAIVAGIVEAHSGGVTVRNVPGGCQFDVTLPRSGPAPPEHRLPQSDTARLMRRASGRMRTADSGHVDYAGSLPGQGRRMSSYRKELRANSGANAPSVEG
jgi:signal transduction histidine kinase